MARYYESINIVHMYCNLYVMNWLNHKLPKGNEIRYFGKSEHFVSVCQKQHV